MALVLASCGNENSSGGAHAAASAGASNAGSSAGGNSTGAAGANAAGDMSTAAGTGPVAGTSATAGANDNGGTAGTPSGTTIDPIARKPGSRRGRLVFDRYSLRASFDSDAGYPEYTWQCHLSVGGDCEFERCSELGANDKPRFIDAGALTVTNLSNNKSLMLQVASASPSSSEHLYGAFPADELVPMPGDQIRIAAAGSAQVPSFETTVVVPANVIVSSPSGNHTFSLAAGLRFRWSGKADFVRAAARIGGYGFDGANPSFKYSSYCVFPGAGGDATLPPGALAPFQCVGAGTSYLSGVGESQVSAGDYAISVQWLQPQGETLIFTSQCTP